MGRNSKIHIPAVSHNKVDTGKQDGGSDWFFVRTNIGLYSKKMGEITGKFLLNLLGITTAVWGFLSNLPNPISILLGIISIMWTMWKALEKREDWLMKRSQRRQHERDNKTNDVD